MVGEVTQDEVNHFKQINPNIADDFNRVFNGSWNIPKLGIAVGASLAGFTTIINSTLPFRCACLIIPVFIDYLRISNDVLAQ